MDHKKFFKLQEDEKIVESIKPLTSLRTFLMLKGIMSLVIYLAIMLFLIVTRTPLFNIMGVYLILLFLITAVPSIIIPILRYRKQHYWVTNKRVIYKRGTLGYKITSIPLERISDIIVSRSFLENIFGFGSLHIESMSGQFTGRTKYQRGGKGLWGSEGKLLAVPDPEELQKTIFELTKKKRKDEKLTM